MSAAGPEIPAELLAKRKRQEDAQDTSEAGRPASPLSPSSSPASAGKRRRVIGPSLPPAPLGERPEDLQKSDDGDSSSEGEMGPALPVLTDRKKDDPRRMKDELMNGSEEPERAPEKLRREEWMLVPPKQDDWTSRVDPTKLRNRKFNTGMGAKAPPAKSGGNNELWTETPEQRRQRLADEVMGVRRPATEQAPDPQAASNSSESRATAKRIEAYNEKHRHQSLYDEHKNSARAEPEDDPSQRAFDKEKDIGGGRKVGHAQRKELLNRAADFGSKFARGNYL